MWSFTLSGIMGGAGTGLWFELLMHCLPPTSPRNILWATAVDNGQNLVLAAAVQAGNACVARVPVWPVLRQDFPPIALVTLAVHVPLDLFIFFFVRRAVWESVLSVLADGLTTIVLSYFTFRHIRPHNTSVRAIAEGPSGAGPPGRSSAVSGAEGPLPPTKAPAPPHKCPPSREADDTTDVALDGGVH